jgi:outer membrane receptor protein involved in Fe transport
MASAVFQSVPGLPRRITYVVSRAQVPALTLSSVTIQDLNAPGTSYLPRLNQLDLKFSKTINHRSMKIQPEIGIFNLTNRATYLSQNNAFGPTLDRVQSVLDGRVVRLGVQVGF